LEEDGTASASILTLFAAAPFFAAGVFFAAFEALEEDGTSSASILAFFAAAPYFAAGDFFAAGTFFAAAPFFAAGDFFAAGAFFAVVSFFVAVFLAFFLGGDDPATSSLAAFFFLPPLALVLVVTPTPTAALNCSSVQISTPLDWACVSLDPPPVPDTRISVFPVTVLVTFAPYSFAVLLACARVWVDSAPVKHIVLSFTADMVGDSSYVRSFLVCF